MQNITDKEIIVIVAYLANSLGIGYKGNLPWKKIKADMDRFKKETTGHTVIMGKDTWLSIPEPYRPLPDRQNIVVSTTLQPSELKKRALLARSLNDAIHIASREKIFLIGGAGIYKEAMETGVANKIIATEVYKDLDADRFFPSINHQLWRTVSEQNPPLDTTGGIKIQFLTLVNIKNPHISEKF